ncbi:MAG TPA: ATP-grasp domain-containing protein [Rhizomicrobium sp.]|nr:ATP-grasp domain-containing protein [Rhizomicrobium sp.]
MRSLLLATNFSSQYRALRCLAALSGEVSVLGSRYARSLALSRYCRRFVPFEFESADPLSAAARLDQAARELAAEVVVPGDLPTALFLARIRPHLSTSTFPVGDASALEALGTKDRFMELCRSLGVAHPEGRVFENAAALKQAFSQGRIALPAMLKPLNLAGGIGVQRIDSENAEREIERISYVPILVQQFVEGTDRCISLFCRGGEVLKQTVYEHADGEFRFLADMELERVAGEIVSALKFTGVIGFDARIGFEGTLWMIECNPRFTFNMDVAMVAGMNFADWKEPATEKLWGLNIRIPDALLRAVLKLQRPHAADFRMLVHWLKDPLVFALVALGYQQRWRLPFFEHVMTRGKCAA